MNKFTHAHAKTAFVARHIALFGDFPTAQGYFSSLSQSRKSEVKKGLERFGLRDEVSFREGRTADAAALIVTALGVRHKFRADMSDCEIAAVALAACAEGLPILDALGCMNGTFAAIEREVGNVALDLRGALALLVRVNAVEAKNKPEIGRHVRFYSVTPAFREVEKIVESNPALWDWANK